MLWNGSNYSKLLKVVIDEVIYEILLIISKVNCKVLDNNLLSLNST